MNPRHTGPLFLLSLFTATACGHHDKEKETTPQGPELALASSLPEACASPEVQRMVRPVSSQDSALGRFSYGFRYKAPTTEGAPVVVMLPGGPGQAYIGTPQVMGFVPPDWGYLLTDPRGVGCNTLAQLPEGDQAAAFYRTSELAEDVISAIQTLGSQRYILFGVSYGTLLGTTVAAELEARGLPPPQAVVLEGVLGRAFTSEEFVGADLITQWERVRSVLPADVRTELDTQPTPYGIDAAGWLNVLMTLLPASPSVTAQNLGLLSPSVSADPAVREAALQRVKAFSVEDPPNPASDWLYRWVSCREIADTMPANQHDVVFSGGALVRNAPEEGTLCRELSVTTPFDSADHPFSAPVYYFLGADDVLTPPWQGSYAYDNHRGKATRLTTAGGGHNSLRLNQGACAPQVMTSIAGGGADLASVAATCPYPVQLVSKEGTR